MANENFIDANGLTIQSLNEIIAAITLGYQLIYGADIIVTSNSPDGQQINLTAQQKRDLLEVVQSIYNNFDPDQAKGVVLDQRVAINNIQRQGATYTLQDIQVTVDRALTLQGLDGDFDNPDGVGFTVSDNNGNRFILIDSQNPAVAGTNTYAFRAALLGAVETMPDTITEQSTIVLGVTAVNNATGAEEVGQNEETDAQLRLRRQRSVANASNGYLNGLLGAVLGIDGVTDASIYENVTNTVDSDGIPAHGIWLIVEGGANTDIGSKIYEKKSFGANMKGAVEVDIETPSGVIFTAKFDRPTSESLYIQFDIQPTAIGQTFDTAAIAEYLVNNVDYRIGQYADASSLTTLAQAAIDAVSGAGTGVVSNLQISDDGMGWVYFLETSTKDKKWSLDADNITINVIT